MTTTKTTLGRITVVVLLAVTGCGSKQDEWLTVTDEPAAIAEARRMADRLRDEEIAALQANLDDSFLDTVACIASGFGSQGEELIVE